MEYEAKIVFPVSCTSSIVSINRLQKRILAARRYPTCLFGGVCSAGLQPPDAEKAFDESKDQNRRLAWKVAVV